MSYFSLFFSFKDKSPWLNGNGINIINPLIVAMTEMGISTTQIRKVANRFLEQNSVPALDESGVLADTITKENWTQYLGRHEAYTAYCSFFEQMISEEPENIRNYFKAMEDGLFSNDLFSLIRLAYAFESGEKSELAAAFAFYAAGYKKIVFELPDRETKVFIEDMENLKNKKDKYQINGNGISEKISNLVMSSPYLEDFHRLEEENLNIFTLRALSIRLAREVEDDVMKHLFCAVHAFRVISPMLSDFGAAVQQFYMMIQACYLVLGCPELLPAEESKEKTWQLIFQLTAVSQNYSNIFFIYSCYREDQFAKSSIYSEMAYSAIHQEIKPVR